jgi:DNA-binding NtrC family response regulator
MLSAPEADAARTGNQLSKCCMDVNPSAPDASVPLLGGSRTMLSLRQDIERAARCTAKVLITGETGAGKEVVARCIHHQSARSKRPFAAVNCSGITETLLESELFGHVRGSFTDAHRDSPGLIRQAQGGTLFLDELGEMSLRMQAMLLRFADTGEMQPVGALGVMHGCDVRLITATNRDLQALIETGAFRQDLFYRVNVIAIFVPPLRDHAEDVPDLLQHYLQRASSTHGMMTPQIDPSATDALIAYSWPGNVRELRNVAERLVLEDFQRPVTAQDLRFSSATQHDAAIAAVTAESSRTEPLWEQFEAGKNFWTVVYQPFKHRELTRRDVTELIHDGLSKTAGSYRNLLALFNLPAADYKRFHAFLRQQNCNLEVRRYRRLADDAPADARAVNNAYVRHTAADSGR